jgi:hypothetical protein
VKKSTSPKKKATPKKKAGRPAESGKKGKAKASPAKKRASVLESMVKAGEVKVKRSNTGSRPQGQGFGETMDGS